MINQYGPILFHYDVYPTKIEDFGNVKKVYSYRGNFALKETRLPQNEVERFIHFIRGIERKGYQNHVPIFPTKYGEYFVTTGDVSYYLMPWIENHPIDPKITIEELLIEQMGIIHRLTIHTENFSQERSERAYLALLKRWDRRKRFLTQFADEAECKTYMSPFELAFMTHYYYLTMLIDQAKQHLDNWLDLVNESKKLRTVLCHGKLSRNHALINEEGLPRLINFEWAIQDTPARDLALFFRHAFRYNLWDEEALYQWLSAYYRHNELLEEEKELLLAYLFFPEPVVYAVEQYVKNNDYYSEIEHVQRFERRMMIMRKVQRLKSILKMKEKERS